MSLQVWLPLNGDLHNQGLSNITVTVSGTTTFDNNGKIGKCLSSNGSSYWTISPINLGTKASICWWAKTSDTNAMFWVLNASVYTYLNFWLYNGKYYLNVGDSTNNPFNNNGTNVVGLSDGLWHHYATIFDGSSCKLYIDGAYYGIAKTYKSPATPSNSNIKLNGGFQNNHTYDTNGLMNDFRVYDHCLSPKEIKEISKGLVLHYKLDDPYIMFYDYLQSDGNSWIDTLIPYDSTKLTYKIECKFSQPTNVSSYDAIFGAYTNESSKCLRIIRGNNNSKMWLYYNSKASGGNLATFSTSNTNIKEISITSTTAILNESGTITNYTYSNYSGNNTTSKFYLFAQGIVNSNISCPSKSRIYYWRIYDNNKIIGDFIPCSYNGVPGMWDKVENKFYPNNGTGTFTLGTNLYNTVYDCSGYKYNGIITGSLTLNNDTPRYNYSTVFSSSQITSNDINLDGNSVFTISCWIKLTTSQSYQPVFWFGDGTTSHGFCLHGGNANRIEGGDGTNRFDNSSFTNIPLNTWKHIVFTYNGTTISEYVNGVLTQTLAYSNKFGLTLKRFYIGKFWAGNIKGNMSDIRLYATALSDTDIKELYDTPANIDNYGNMFSFEFDEDDISKEQILKTGITKIDSYEEFNNRIKVLDDNSVFIQILHHNNPASNLFTESNCWLYNDNNNLYSALILLKNSEWINNLTEYEFLACEKLESSSTENQIRWKQTSNPAIATSPTGFTLISGTSSYLSPGLVADTGHGCFDMNGGSWWCCCGCYVGYSGGIPGFGGVVKSGYVDLYIRIPDNIIKGNFNDFVRFYQKSILSNQFIEK